MNWFKRLCMFVFGVSGVLSLAALSLVWVGPWTSLARSLITENRPYHLALEVLVCISAVGLLACVLVALFAPRNTRETEVAQVQGGAITVTRTAIVSQTKHIIEADGTCNAGSIRVRMRKRGNIRVNVRVVPRAPVDVIARGEVLYAALESGLAKVCGNSVKSIGIVFTEPEQAGTMSDYFDGSSDGAASSATATASPAQDIVVHMPVHDETPAPVAVVPAEDSAEPADIDAVVAESSAQEPFVAPDGETASQVEEA